MAQKSKASPLPPPSSPSPLPSPSQVPISRSYVAPLLPVSAYMVRSIQWLFYSQSSASFLPPFLACFCASFSAFLTALSYRRRWRYTAHLSLIFFAKTTRPMRLPFFSAAIACGSTSKRVPTLLSCWILLMVVLVLWACWWSRGRLTTRSQFASPKQRPRKLRPAWPAQQLSSLQIDSKLMRIFAELLQPPNIISSFLHTTQVASISASRCVLYIPLWISPTVLCRSS
ncbi:hypothetical protein P280DRAFT_542113, partial [Massarina eburnea CBS 473.64]